MPTYKDLIKTFDNIDTAKEKEIINIIPEDSNKKFPSSYRWEPYQLKRYPTTDEELQKDKAILKEELDNLRKEYDKKDNLTQNENTELLKRKKEIKNLKTLKKHKGNFGIVIGFNPDNNPYWLGCLDIDGDKTNNKTEQQTKEDFIKILSKLEGTILIKTQGGGYHLYFLTKTSYDKEYITNICFPKDYTIKEIANKDITTNNKAIELFTNNNRQMAIPPSTIGKNKYERISELKDFNELKVYDDILEDVYKLLKEAGFSYKEIETYTKKDKPYRSEDEKTVENKEKNNSTTENPEYEEYENQKEHIRVLDKRSIEKIAKSLAPHFKNMEGQHSELYLALSGDLKRKAYIESSVRQLANKLMHLSKDKKKDHLREVKSTYKRNNKNQTGFKTLKKLLEANPKNDKNELAKDLKQYQGLTDHEHYETVEIFKFNDKYSLKISPDAFSNTKKYQWISTTTQKGKSILAKGINLDKEDTTRDSSIVNQLCSIDKKIESRNVYDFLRDVGIEIIQYQEDKEEARKEEYKLRDNEEDNEQKTKSTPANMEKVNEFNELLAKDYDNDAIEYIKDTSNYLIYGESNNIVKEILTFSMTIVLGVGLFNQIQGDKDTGKNYIKDTALKFVPTEHLILADDYTKASFIDEGMIDPKAFDRMIIDLNDLGSIDALDDVTKGLFDVGKPLISEKRFTKKKLISNKKTGRMEPVTIRLEGSPNFTYCTVEPKKSDKLQEQIESRSLVITPYKNTREEKLEFQNKTSREYTKEYYNYRKKEKEIELFVERLKWLRDIESNYTIDVVFNNTIDDFTKEARSLTDTREAKLQKKLFKIYMYLNIDRCYKKKLENGKTLLLPNIIDLKNFIDIMVGDVGLKMYEKDVLLSLKDFLQIPTDTQVFNLIESVKNEIEEENRYISEVRVESKTTTHLMAEYGLNKNRKAQTLDATETFFFTVSKFNQKYKAPKELKRIKDNAGDPSQFFSKCYEHGYLERTELLYRGDSYIYYLTSEVNEIMTVYEFKEDIIKKDIETLKFLLTKDNKPLLTETEINEYVEEFVKNELKMYEIDLNL